MAKKPRIVVATPQSDAGRPTFDPRLIASGFLGASLVYLAYHPSDAAAVENGDALWFATLALATCLFTFAAQPSMVAKTESLALLRSSRLLDLVVCSLAAWMMFAAFANSSVGNLRLATNEAWLWISGAALFVSVRRLAIQTEVRRAIAVLIVVCATGLAVHSLHQELVTLPLNRLAFEQDPESVLKQAGYDAPEGSAERAIFAGRLIDGGPTATFALANSLAALLISGVLLSAGIVRFGWSGLSGIQRITWSVAGVLSTAGLLATRSRSAMIATLLGLFLTYVGQSSWSQANKKLFGGIGIASLLIGGIAWVYDRDVFSTAPASLAFRFQYWWATLRMVWDRPLFGAGPGHFQAAYESYREATTSEQIADPHNLFFETLGSGGFVGLALLLASFFLGVRYVSTVTRNDTAAVHPVESDHGRSIWFGATIALLLVWLFGFATRELPDVDASLYVLPIIALAAFILSPSISALESRHLDFLFGIVLLMLVLHLTVSGGWTVPGVAILVWLTAGILTRIEYQSGTTRNASLCYWALGLCLALMALLYFLSLRPVVIADQQMAIASESIKAGRHGQAEQALKIAAEADRWSPIPVIGLADQYRWRLIQEDTPTVRQSWESELARARSLGGQDPALLRVIGTQQLHLFQRHGRPEDLAAADKTFELAVEWSPVNQWMIAQLAAIAMAAGDRERASKLTVEAKRLSGLGVNAERRFGFQSIYPAKHFGEVVKRGPIRLTADQVLSEPR